jgi:murein DD-endopeptidase MepM/ murein hydrolase activator NlpD
LNRRRFLRYGAGAAAIAGSALAGYEFGRWQTSLVPPSVSTVTETQTLHQTTTEIAKLASVHGRLFFDFNGNGVQNTGEPVVAGALVQLKDNVGKVIAEALTDSSGDYKLEDVKAGRYRLRIEAESKFRYMCTSGSQFRPVSGDYDLALNEPTKLDLGLMEGFLTLPFGKGTNFKQSIFVDLDPSSRVRDWKGGNFSYDGHRGIDYDMPQLQKIVATAPGIIVEAEDGWPNNPRVNYTNLGLMEDGNRIIIDHENGTRSIYAHLHGGLKVDPRPLTLLYTASDNLQKVERGQFIALSGNTGTRTMGPHLHFQVNRYSTYGEWGSPLDPYRDSYYGTHGYSPYSNNISLWTKDNDPQYATPG